MASTAASQGSPKKVGFIREALAELRRRRERRRLRKQGEQQQQTRAAALVWLGQRAWEAQAGLADFPELREQLAALDGQAAEAAGRIQQSENQKAALEARQNEETGKYNSQRQVVEQKKAPVDAALQAARQNCSAWECIVQQGAARQSRVVAQLAAVEQELVSLAAGQAPDRAAKLAAAQAQKEQLVAERTKLTGELVQGQSALPLAQADVARLSEESQRQQAEIDRIETERRNVLAPLQAALQRITGELSALRQQATSVAAARTENFQKLGLALYSSQTSEPALRQDMEQIAATDRTSAATAQALQASLALSRAVPRGTMGKFWSAVILLPMLLIGLGIGLYAGYDWWHERKLAKEFELPPAPINPYLSHALARHPAYALADRLVEARSQARVQDLMLEAFRGIHLGVYTHDGRQILAGAETNDQDFYLYDFHWKTLARAYYAHDVMDFSHHSALLAKALLETDDAARVEADLSQSMQHRFQEAQKSPDDPASFLILLVDGLARRQWKPYTLSELGQRPGKDLQVDPLQSFLIMLDFFMQQQNATPPQTHWWQRDLLPVVHAEGVCDAIKGDQAQKGWGFGVKIGSLGLGAPGKAVPIAGAVGDLILLYGITIKVTPTNYNFHLHHEDDYSYGFTAKVYFDPEGIPDEAIRCGWLAGKTMPKQGQPLKDVELTWNIEPVWPSYLIVPHETVQRLTGHLGFQTKTDADGESDFGITPTDCPHKKGGKVVGRDLMMTATARVLTRKMPTPGTLGWISILTKLGPGAIEYLMNGRTGYCRFRVEWHDKSPGRPQRGGIVS